jgi:hypothetical protein
MAPRTVNILCGVWVAIPVYFLARSLAGGDEWTGKVAAALTVFFPSMILWSVLNIREAPTILAIVSIVYFPYRSGDRFRGLHLLGLMIALTALALSREYLFALVACSAGIGLLVSRLRSAKGRVGLAVVLLVMVVMVVARTDLGIPSQETPALDVLDYLRRDMAVGARSAYGADADTTTIPGLLRYLPIGLAHFLLAPFPWAIGSTLQAATLPEQLVWYVLLFFAFWGIWRSVREDPRGSSVVLFVMGTIVVSYSLVEGNVGTAFRHRAQVYPFFFVFVAMGLGRLREIRHASRARQMAVRRSVLKTLPGRRRARDSGPGQGEIGGGI